MALPQIEVVTYDEDQEDLFRLRRDAYVDAGFLPPTSPPLFRDQFDAAASTLTLAARMNGARIGGMRFSVSRPEDGAATLPCGSLEGVRRARSSSNGTLVEFSRFVLAPDMPVFSRTSISAALVRAGLLMSKVLETETIFLASRPGLVGFYRASMGFTPISSLERFPPGPGEEPVILMSLDPTGDRESRFPFFQISPTEIASVRMALYQASQPSQIGTEFSDKSPSGG